MAWSETTSQYLHAKNATSRFKVPSIRRRMAALLYESFLIFAVLIVAGFAYIPIFGGVEGPFRKAVFQLYLIGVILFYFLTFWTRGGQTLAMKTWRIQLTDLDGAVITVPRGLLRFTLAMFSLSCLGVGFLWAIFDRERQFLHDRLAKTRLISVA